MEVTESAEEILCEPESLLTQEAERGPSELWPCWTLGQDVESGHYLPIGTGQLNGFPLLFSARYLFCCI